MTDAIRQALADPAAGAAPDARPPVSLQATPDGVAVVAIDRPHRKNAFDAATLEALHGAFATLRTQSTVRTVFVRGVGGAFCAGADLDWMRAAAGFTEAQNREDAMGLARMLHALYDLPQLTVALVEGPAFGGGAGLAAACDMALATPDAVFSFSEVRLGLTPATISPYVVAAIGARAARRLFATGVRFAAEEARRLRLVDRVVEDAEALAHAAVAIAHGQSACAPEAVGEAKRLVADVAGREIDGALMAETARRIAARRVSPEGREGLAAFLERRPPAWAGAPG